MVSAIIKFAVLSNSAAAANMTLEDMQLAMQMRLRLEEHRRRMKDARVSDVASQSLQRGSAQLLESHGLEADEFENMLSLAITGSRGVARLWSLFLNAQPILKMYRYSVQFSRAARLLLFSVRFWGALAASAVFFSVSGTAVSVNAPDVCSGKGGALELILISGIASAVFGQLVEIVLARIKQRRFVFSERWSEESILKKLRFWKIRDAVVDLAAISYLACTMTYVYLFLVNVSVNDITVWVSSSLVAVLKGHVVIPAIRACLLLILSHLGFVARMEAQYQSECLESDCLGEFDIVSNSNRCSNDAEHKQDKKAEVYQEVFPMVSQEPSDICTAITCDPWIRCW